MNDISYCISLKKLPIAYWSKTSHQSFKSGEGLKFFKAVEKRAKTAKFWSIALGLLELSAEIRTELFSHGPFPIVFLFHETIKVFIHSDGYSKNVMGEGSKSALHPKIYACNNKEWAMLTITSKSYLSVA